MLELIILCIYLLIVVTYIIKYIKNYTRERAITHLAIIILLPFAGALMLAFSSWTLQRKSQDSFSSYSDEDISAQTSTLGIYNRIDIKKEINIVPIEEALLLNDTTTKRRMLIDALKNDSIEYIGILQKALENEDTETSHYAATAVLEIKRKLMLTKQKFSVKYEENKFDLETLIPYVNVLKNYLTSGFLDERTVIKTKHTYSQVLESLLSIYTEEEAYFVDKIECDLEIGNVDKARSMCESFHQAHPNSETPYLISMKTHYTLRNNERFQDSLNGLKNSPIRLSNQALNIVRFWSGV
ncbi:MULTISPECIES: hypothetical protein [unclassified Paenibacillus]|uniref:hypothetical protein n=1 Tax=unclassified Paenibacillus TaxID=185978 RepID=UPI000710EFDA|nr:MULTISPECIES: hypothetical protein [unclassified Paenibacillus]KQX66379.1 hypothetical protein ASD40_28220 [Paenibacillus sp. Root444D2]KRE40962.1 hypothetical protein ASG85_34365 [Paenibacillus sp. Soil724D2]